ncbi:MAG: adenylosuccinate synthase [Planctomycetes bacterium]|nr:adenylosuccinate synthase [Planctomycetota bacterium]
MPSLSVFGAQWGDEGKGKIIDLLSADVDYVVRYQGGANAGHTVIVGGEKYVLHLVPSGILHPGRINVVGNGLAVDPVALLDEVRGLRERGVAVSGENLRLSGAAHVIFDYHRLIDQLSERWLGAGRIGTTGRGIGPCYADKAARTGLRFFDLADPDRCRTRLRAALAEKNALIEKVHGEAPLDLEGEVERYVALGAELRPFVGDTGAEVRAAYRAGKSVLFEGAQGAMLDLDHGTYPYVTSSSTGTNGIPAGAGFPAKDVERSIGIAKAYCTRVGEGAFPTEDHGADGAAIRDAGNEYGATTGRPRRCGWFDAVAVRYALELNGAEALVITNLDVLTGFPEIKVATQYRRGAQRYDAFPAGDSLEGLEPVYQSLPGWSEDLTAVRTFDALPANARRYVEWLEEAVGVPIQLLSVGPDRKQVIPRGLASLARAGAHA